MAGLPPTPPTAPAAGRAAPRRLALIVDPRFPGGTSTAVAAEIRALAGHVEFDVVGIETAMFRGRAVNPALQDALDAHGLAIRWNPPVVRADAIVVHNLASLKFERALDTRLSCATALVVTHENLLRPGGAEGFDVAHCLGLVRDALVSGTRRLAPVSASNRRSAADWLARSGADWSLAPFDWFSVCDMPLHPPTALPRDRRGRHSRPGPEKFPPMATMLRHFPPAAERVLILGADRLMWEPELIPGNWDLRRFGDMDVDRFLQEVDFIVYFTHPLWRESFGRAIAEAVAAGKVVITDPGTAESFGPAVVASDGSDVDAVIAGFLAAPEHYADHVARAQAWLRRLGPEAFRATALAGLAGLARIEGADHALL